MKRYGLLGYPLTHSFSKRFFTAKFKEENVDSSYENFEIDNINKFPEVVKKNPDIVGFNVTIPYKEQVIPFLDELNDAAREIGAVNTIRVKRSGNSVHLKGFNTDTFGFETSLQPLLKDYHQKALILGTGGASKALKYVLDKLGIDYLSVSRKKNIERGITYEAITREIMQERLLIINATPLGTYPKVDTYPNIPYEFIGNRHLLFDVVYNPEESQFLRRGKERGAAIKNGYEMLLNQAIKSYQIWTSEE